MMDLVATGHTQSPIGPCCLFLVCFETEQGHRDGVGDDASHTVSLLSWLPVPRLLRDARGHRDGFGDDVSHTVLSVVAACSLSASRRNGSVVMTSMVAVVVVSEGFITDPQDDEIQLDVILVVCEWNSVLLRSSTYVRASSAS